MCRHFSCLLTKDSVYTAESGSHEEMIRAAGLRDNTREPDFVRVEVTPPDNNYSLPPEQWVYSVGQDYLPPWYVATVEEERARRALAAWYATHVQRDGEQVVNDGEFCIALGTCRQTINGGAGCAYHHATQTINAGRGWAHDRAAQTIRGGEGYANHHTTQTINAGGGYAYDHATQTISGGGGSAYGHATQTINAGVGYAYHRATQTINAGVGYAHGVSVKVIDNRK